MTNPLKELLERIGVDIDNAEVVHMGCNVEQDIARLQAKISNIPSGKGAEPNAVFNFGLETVRRSAKSMVKEGRKKALELEMRMLDKPDDVDLGADEHKHTAMHLEEDQLMAEAIKREGEALLAFCDMVESRLGEDFN